MKEIGEGAEAKVYEGELLGIRIVVKDRIRKRYRIPEIDSELRQKRTKIEARLLYTASANGLNVPNVLLVDGSRLFIRKIDGKNLHEAINGSMQIVPERLNRAIYDSGVCCGALHNLDIAHGDYTPANMMVDRNGTLWIIDFGLAETTRSVEEKALDLLLMKRAVPSKLFGSFLKGYRKSCTSSVEIINRLAEIERRGRYQTRTLITA